MEIFNRYYFARFESDNAKHWRMVGAYFWKNPCAIVTGLVNEIEEGGNKDVNVIEFRRIRRSPIRA